MTSFSEPESYLVNDYPRKTRKKDTRKSYHVKQDTHSLFLQIKNIIGKTSMVDQDNEDKILFSIFSCYLKMRYN